VDEDCKTTTTTWHIRLPMLLQSALAAPWAEGLLQWLAEGEVVHATCGKYRVFDSTIIHSSSAAYESV
jgi:hypothetical protein